MKIFSRLFKARDKPKNSLFSNAYSFFFGGTSSGKAVNERAISMKAGMARQPVFSGIACRPGSKCGIR